MPKYLAFSNDVAPARDGVYQREFFDVFKRKQVWYWAVFKNNRWSVSYRRASEIPRNYYHSAYQVKDKSPTSSLRWRGLAEKPE